MSRGGMRKGAGRKAGSPNKASLATRERIEKEADPLGYFIRVAQGQKVMIDGEEAVPTLRQVEHANKVLLNKTLPDLKSVEMSGSLGLYATHEECLEALDDAEKGAVDTHTLAG